MREFLPRKLRKPVYGLYALAGLALGSIEVWFTTAEAGTPAWVAPALAVYAFVGGGIGATASVNTPQPAPTIPDGDGEHRADV